MRGERERERMAVAGRGRAGSAMNSSDHTPRIPLWVFFATDFALLAAAAFVAAYSPRPLGTGAMLGIVACVITGAGVALIPLVLRFERQKNETLDDRQRALEALASTVASSAEQIGIATAGLQQIGDVVQKNLRHLDQLPHRLQEKVAELQAQLSNVNDAEKDELEKELAALRSTETERLESVSDRLTRTAAEFAKLEAATHQHLSAASEAVGKLALGTANAIGKAQAAAEQALSHARVEAARQVGETAGQNLKSIDAAKAAALAEVDARLAAAAHALSDRLARDLGGRFNATLAALDEKLTRLEAAARHAQALVAAPGSAAESAAPAPAAPPPPADEPPPPAPKPPAPTDEHTSASPRRARKSRRDETAAEPAPAPAAGPNPPVTVAEEPPPVPVNRIPEVAPIAPHTAEPFVTSGTGRPSGSGNGSGPTHAPSASAPPARNERRARHDAGSGHELPPRKRADAAEPADEAGTVESSTDAPVSSAVVERVLTSDGATRLIVTAYIGIGNRLFIRGKGPGLSWDKGVPLQFVSIGKWRWETNDAAEPVEFKLLKNDEQECAALGAQTLDPGHQQEVTAAF